MVADRRRVVPRNTGEQVAPSIQPVRTRTQLAEFIGLPRQLYRDLPGYVAPLDRERRELLDPRRSGFFAHGIARYWLARDGATAIGRVSAQIDHLSRADESGKVGMFGCLDAIDDESTIRILLNEAEQWLRRRGCQIVRGPFLLSINNEAGLLLDGHREPPVSLMPWQPPYLERSLQAAGYKRKKTLQSYTLDLTTIDPAKVSRTLGLDRKRPEFVIRGLQLNDLNAEAEIVARIFNDAWQHNWGFTPLTALEVRTVMHRFRPFLFPYSATFVEYGGETVAIYLGTPNLFEISADLGATPSVLAWAKFATRVLRGKYRSHRILLFGVASRYHNSVVGAAIAAAVLGHNIKITQSGEFRFVEAGWVLDDNRSMIDILERLGFEQTRRFGVYEKLLAG
jgi:hypothetical protein